MQLKNLILAASAAATVSAAPAEGKPFGVLAIHSGSGVQDSGFNAAKGSLFAGLTSQNASCARPEDSQTATFYIKDGALFLYDQSATPQEFYVDRSGMGMLASPLLCFSSEHMANNKHNRSGQDRLHHWCPTAPQERRAEGLVHQRAELPPVRRQQPDRLPQQH